MKIAFFSTKPYDIEFFTAANHPHGFELNFLEPKLNAQSAPLAAGSQAVCVFVNDQADAEALQILAELGVKTLALRCAGFNNVDLKQAEGLGIAVVRVPAYSPHAVAEHTVGLILTLNRRVHRAYNRIREHNFELQGLLGFDLYGKTVGVIGTGKIGVEVIKILRGFGCQVLAYDLRPNDAATEAGAQYVELNELFAKSRIVTLHCPLTAGTRHLINASAIDRMPQGVMLVNTSRGAVIDSIAVLAALKSGRIGSLALDVYEEEEIFFQNVSDAVLQDDVLARLLTFPNVLVTGHQAFFTQEALSAIADTTLNNIAEVSASGHCGNLVKAE